MLLKKYFSFIWESATRSYKSTILSLLKKNPLGKLLDLGCDDGIWTMQLAKKMQCKKKNIFGIELIKERYIHAIKKGITVKQSDLNHLFPFKDKEFDVVHANQVIEHVWDLDMFVSEIKRVLKDDGYAIICTENLSSWHNIFALCLGFQPFSLANISTKGSIGNPFSLGVVEGPDYATWNHTRVLSYQGLRDIFQRHGFKVEVHKGCGYFPFPPLIASVFSFFDPRHAAFPVIKVTKI